MPSPSPVPKVRSRSPGAARPLVVRSRPPARIKAAIGKRIPAGGVLPPGFGRRLVCRECEVMELSPLLGDSDE